MSVGAVHDRLICDEELVVAVNPVGGCGVVLDVTVLDVVAEDIFDGGLVPATLIADTL